MRVVKGAGSSLNDLEAYKRAAAFFFPGCVVEMKLTIYMSLPLRLNRKCRNSPLT